MTYTPLIAATIPGRTVLKRFYKGQIEATSTIARSTTQKGYHHTRIYFFPKNFPNPTRTCTVLIPGFGVVSPAFEICM